MIVRRKPRDPRSPDGPFGAASTGCAPSSKTTAHSAHSFATPFDIRFISPPLAGVAGDYGGRPLDIEGESTETFGMELIDARQEDQRHEDQFRAPIEILDEVAHMSHSFLTDRTCLRRLFEKRCRREGLMHLPGASVVAHDL